ncbi:hypothetical protein BU25DRAFT_104302 [Macroventuria anomochaeta]|uniref:Uncharacterized protein n=1 Tax=Macroventuria anomochaeta TaxID=301207 RepID=A0ACB6RYC6_9PLEO|nr:uncharacterized protein BU25DRAFT_104302 [Macroventuria anomochaeta]KAF2626262.1 hypothetical protein BU25DRAFT_104302 [Macroventuria anomochaeta]
MTAIVHPKTALIATQEPDDKTFIKPSDSIKIDITRLPADKDELEDTTPATTGPSRTALHIYFEPTCGHKLITPTLSPSQERRWGPSPKQQKARRIAKKEAKKLRETNRVSPSSLTPPGPPPLPVSTEPVQAEEGSYFLHTPYVSFHLPPSVLYVGSERYAPSRPVALVHGGWFWRSYKIQLGPSLAISGVIDPRGVVSYQHNGGDKKTLQRNEAHGDGRMLKGYKVRGWRLWGETGKSYVHTIRSNRKAGISFDDPDIENKHGEGRTREKVKADEVVYLRWTTPLSRQTRCYTFQYRGIEFQWKGTGTVSEGRRCGWLLRFCHLKLVAQIPFNSKPHAGKEDGMREVCLAKYTSSIATEKSGALEIFDSVVLRFVQDCVPGLLVKEVLGEEKGVDGDGDEEDKIARLKGGVLYQVIVATVLCMVNAEKEKRHTLIDLIIGAGENAGNGGG